MKYSPVVIFCLFLAAFACNTSQVAKKPGNTAPVTDTGKFYPLADFFKEQIRYVDLHDFPIYRITVKNGKKDSSAITKDVFATVASVFLRRDIAEPSEKILYKESVFEDLSTSSVTFNYTSTTPNTLVQNIDILLDGQTKIVKRVFIRSSYNQGDTIVQEQYNWKANKSFQISKTMNTATGYKLTESDFINWNDKE